MVKNVRYANGHRRREVRARVLAEEHICALCGGPVDKSLTVTPDGKPHPMRAEVDEIVPVSRGGSPYDRSNTQLAHRFCNAAKGNRLHALAEVPDAPQWPLSEGW